MRGVGIVAPVDGGAAQLPHFKAVQACVLTFLFHVMPLLICTSPQCALFHILQYKSFYRGADKSLARPGRKQATATEDFDFYIFYL